jgi:hypothetical protein
VHTVQNQGMRLNLTSMPRGQHDRIRFDLDKNMCSIVNQLRLLYTSEHYAIKHPTLKEGVNTGCLGIRIMFPSGATCLSADCCFSEVAIYNTQLRVLVYYKADLIIITRTHDLLHPRPPIRCNILFSK